MWKLKSLQDYLYYSGNLKTINNKFVPARPLNFTKKYMSFKQRLKDAWEVFRCRAEAFKWPEGQ